MPLNQFREAHEDASRFLFLHRWTTPSDRTCSTRTFTARSDGHNTCVAETEDQWVINDTYPDRGRLLHPYVRYVPSGQRVPLAHLLSPREYRGEWRCDLHPCNNRDGTQVVLDSTHEGPRWPGP